MSDIVSKKGINFSSHNNVQYCCFQTAEIEKAGAASVITINSLRNFFNVELANTWCMFATNPREAILGK